MEPPSSTVDSIECEFPRGPTKPGKVYVMDTPFNERICIMSEPTWTEFGTRQEAMRQMLGKQDTRIKELLAENALAKQTAFEAVTRLENIRAVRRDELRTRIEPEVNQLLMPDDPSFGMPKRKN